MPLAIPYVQQNLSYDTMIKCLETKTYEPLSAAFTNHIYGEAKKFNFNPRVDFYELVQIGHHAVIEAAEKFNLSRVPLDQSPSRFFSAYAIRCIRTRMLKAINHRDLRNQSRMSDTSQSDLNIGRHSSEADDFAAEQFNLNQHELIEDTLDDNTLSVVEEWEDSNDENVKFANDLLKCLTEKEYCIYVDYYTKYNESMTDTGKAYNYTSTQIGNILKKAQKKIDNQRGQKC